jgi:subtilisin family serine protease
MMNIDLLEELGITRDLIRSLGIEGCDGRGARVVVVDSGIAEGHPHVGRLVRGVRIEEGSGNVMLVEDDTTDDTGHGTACAGVIRTIAPDCEILSVKILDAQLASSSQLLICAIDWAAKEGEADVINLSLGTRRKDSISLMQASCDEVEKEGAVIVAAVEEGQGTCYPAEFLNVLGVAASNNNRFYTARDRPDLLYAPDYPRPIPGHPRQDNFSGSSFATARITGLAALIVGADKAQTTAGVMDLLNLALPPVQIGP